MSVLSARERFAEFRRLPFPEPGDSEELADWIADLAEVDGYYAGLIDSALAGASKGPLDATHITALRLRLHEISSSIDPKYRTALKEAESYAEALYELVSHFSIQNRRA